MKYGPPDIVITGSTSSFEVGLSCGHILKSGDMYRPAWQRHDKESDYIDKLYKIIIEYFTNKNKDRGTIMPVVDLFCPDCNTTRRLDLDRHCTTHLQNHFEEIHRLHYW
jgi:hypothetical protein